MHCWFIVPKDTGSVGSAAVLLHLCDALFVHCAAIRKSIYIPRARCICSMHCRFIVPEHERIPVSNPKLHLLDALLVQNGSAEKGFQSPSKEYTSNNSLFQYPQFYTHPHSTCCTCSMHSWFSVPSNTTTTYYIFQCCICAMHCLFIVPPE